MNIPNYPAMRTIEQIYPLMQLVEFISEHNGVLVTPDSSGVFTCCICGNRNLFANNIDHNHECPYWQIKTTYDVYRNEANA